MRPCEAKHPRLAGLSPRPNRHLQQFCLEAKTRYVFPHQAKVPHRPAVRCACPARIPRTQNWNRAPTFMVIGSQAAEQGDANAQYLLRLMYARGEGVLQDYTEAVAGTAKPPSRTTPTHSTPSGGCTPTAGASQRMMPKLPPGTAKPPSGAQRRAREWHAAHQVH